MKIPLNWTVPLVRLIYEVWCRTLRYTEVNRETVKAIVQRNETAILALWHDELFPLMHVRGTWPLAAIVSQSRDGELLARFLEGMGIKTARGSSSRGGARAGVKAVQLMRKEKRLLCVTVDGPRGPRHKVKGGVIQISVLAQAPIVPVRMHMSCSKKFASWDRFQLPLPFSKVRIVFGEPYRPYAPKTDQELNRAKALGDSSLLVSLSASDGSHAWLEAEAEYLGTLLDHTS